jgi:transposase
MDWIGYKVHFTETCDEESAHLITHVETTHAAVPDEQILSQVHEALDKQELLPEIHLVDAGYTTAKGLVDSKHDYGVTLVGPVAQDARRPGKSRGRV